MPAALAMLGTIVAPPAADDARLAAGFSDLAPANRLRREFVGLRLFAVLAATKASKRADWQAQGRELFDALFEATLQTMMAEDHESELLARPWLGERIKYYTLSQHLVASLDELGSSVGESFAMLFGSPPADAFSRLGRGVFWRAFEQTLARHADYKLAPPRA